MTIPRLAVVAVTALLVTGCTADNQPAKDSADACAPRGKNLLQDPSFLSITAPRAQRKWSSSEHAAGQTFEYQAQNGELEIVKTGGEPWFILTQSVDPGTVAGKRVTFGAEVKLDLSLPQDHTFTPGGGLTFLARRGSNVVINSSLEHEPRLGQTDWTPVSITLKIPRGTDFVRAGFLHQAEGTLRVRKPYLRIAAKKDCDSQPR
ncbi:hypothetical protein F0M18_09725 [Pseudohalioglobus sediminis]|uniref:Uncharacterized protein n=1 Tax=Pseudohalioglobus sediminis TaxID=2606449 RepID=A0A5B0WZH5_9GAMM|nr:hypothetical protein [Pseudohalioglobus sediminis]KAA1191805.1 hypothetical protein F0M18_09725 [Pseudohalioglobus sediminis]